MPRARTTLGFEPKVTLEQGFTELIDGARTTPDVAEDFFDRAVPRATGQGASRGRNPDSVTFSSRRDAADLLLLVGVFVTTFFYRFNTMGGAFGGFANDEFDYLARARQIQSGDVPFRDFNDPGWFLTEYLSAAMQWLGGYNLRSEALLTVGMLSLGAALTFMLARRAAGTVVAAVVAVVVHVALDARHYNYPKIVLYAVGLALAWAYVDKPGRARLAALGALVGIGFLFRHDHLVYLGALSVTTIALVHHTSMRDGLRAVAGLCGAAAIFIVPFLIFLALSGGVGEYFRAALVYVTVDAERTSFTPPRLSLTLSKPLVALSREPALANARINVRWKPISDEERRDGESRFSLAGGEPLDGTTWTYALRDTSTRNIESLVRDPLVDDTHGLDWTTFAVDEAPRPLRFETQLDTVPNATAFLYYCFCACRLSRPLCCGDFGVPWVRPACCPRRVTSCRCSCSPQC